MGVPVSAIEFHLAELVREFDQLVAQRADQLDIGVAAMRGSKLPGDQRAKWLCDFAESQARKMRKRAGLIRLKAAGLRLDGPAGQGEGEREKPGD